MFVRVKPSRKPGMRSVQLCESRREGARVRQVIVRHVGVAADDQEEQKLRELAKLVMVKIEASRTGPFLFPTEEIAAVTEFKTQKKPELPQQPAQASLLLNLSNLTEESRQNEGITDIFGSIYDQFALEKSISKTAAPVLRATVLARVASPQSKRRTQADLEHDFGQSISLDRIYRMMDNVYHHRKVIQKQIRHRTFRLLGQSLNVCFFDVTTLYFESVKQDELRDFGFSKDQKFQQVQVVLALMTTQEGLPVGYKLFPGSTAETRTLIQAVEEWRQEGSIGRVTVVADRGMMSRSNLEELEQAGFYYIVGSSLKKLPKTLHPDILAVKEYRLGVIEEDAVWLKTQHLDGNCRLISTFSSKRARKDASDRARLVASLEKKLGSPKAGSAKKLVSNQGYLKYSTIDGAVSASIDREKIAADAQWDGMYGVMTNLPKEQDACNVLARYRQLWSIEEAFRVHKHNLRMRPIYHFKPRRIEAHIAICFLAYSVLKNVQYQLRQKNIEVSHEQLRTELARTQISVLRDCSTGLRYRVPSKQTDLVRQVYKAFNLSRQMTPSVLA